MIGEDRREEIEAHLDSLKELRKAYLSHYRFMERNASDEYLSSILEDVHQLEEEIMEVRKQLPPPMSQRQLRALEEIPKAWAEVTGKKDVREVAPPNEARKLLEEANKILNSDEKHLYRTELDEAERKLDRARQIIEQSIEGTVVVKKNPIMKRILELENRKDTLYLPLVAISPFTYREAMKDITEAVERLKKLPSDIVEYGLLPCHVETIIQNYDCLVEEDDQLWIERNIISPDTLESIRDHAFKKVGRIAVVDLHCKMLSKGFYSSKVAKTYMEYTKRMNEEYREMLDKAHEEALDEDLRRDLKFRADKEREEALCQLADKTLQEYADIAAGRIFIDDDNVAHVNGTIKTPRMVIEEAPMRRGLTIKEWFQKWCK